MRIDLHTHSRASDGTQPPGDLVRAAAAAGLDVLAITDHDTADGWAEAEAAAHEVGIELVRGMEVSTRHHGRGVHLLAYLPDPTYPPLVEQLSRVLEGRQARVPDMLERLHALGIEITDADVARAADGTAATGRPHVADALVAVGAVGDRTEAFDRYLGAGRPAYVDRYAAPLAETIRLVTEAGGVTVVAHPWGRSQREWPGEPELAELQAAGLSGIEVEHEDHTRTSRDKLRAIARNLDLVVTGSSDHHGTGKIDHELGCNTTDPEQYARLVDAAARAAEAARARGRTPPDVVRP
ncbi:PHP domain-containing protein [Nocardioides deserti]|uniref:PHP domain-containing protein n=1 Tax=Nocardioides deserti TaxID=1588644 RepID=A0ABR6U8V9_9ACTN|nr:PHP domain-containing protein [Nocardioides deserti]MBC2960884.1 PHP domain-containing protein [Nocardioides deserti]GGO77672.1 phosphatase [Nocardioides deserti]